MERATLESVNTYYEEYMFGSLREAFPIDKIGFFNLGYWKGVEDSIEMAQINLIETLVSFFINTNGTILDVACGKGASTKFLTKYFLPGNITGINISQRQLEICELIAPECSFKLMDATKLEFPDSSIDNVLCIEAAIHFATRRQFLQEAYRILEPGGRLAMSDLLCDYDALENSIKNAEEIPERFKESFVAAVPKENYLQDLDAYREMLLKAGFRYVRVEDSTELSTRALENYEIKRAEREFQRTRNYLALDSIMKAARQARVVTAGCMVYAIK